MNLSTYKTLCDVRKIVIDPQKCNMELPLTENNKTLFVWLTDTAKTNASCADEVYFIIQNCLNRFFETTGKKYNKNLLYQEMLEMLNSSINLEKELIIKTMKDYGII